MRLARVKLKNFRCYRYETVLDVGPLTALVGKNDCGKSALLDALEIFFDDKVPDTDDATVNGDKANVQIICEFEELPESLIIDVDYPTNLKEEHLLNGDGRLEIHKVYNCSLQKPKVKSVFAYAMHPSDNGLSDLLLLKNTELKERASKLKLATDQIDSRVNTQLRMLLWQSSEDLNLQPAYIPLDRESAKQIWEQLKKHLPVYALFKSDRPSTDQDAEAQDPMKSAVKEAIRAKEEELAHISSFVEKRVKEIANRTVAKIKEMDPRLARELSPRFTPPNWANVFKISLTGDEDIPINKRGSGVRRLILLNFFRAKAEQRATERGMTQTIYAIEEPETSQHPFNQRMLFHAFAELGQYPECQVILSTHTPALARLLPLESLRSILIEPDYTRTITQGDTDTYQLVAKELGVLPDHDVKLFIGVEGENDINFLNRISNILSSAGEKVPDLSKLEAQGQIIFIPVGGSNLVCWKSRLANLNRPEFHLFDRDTSLDYLSPKQNIVDEINERSNCHAYLTGKREIENYLHPDAIRTARPDVVLSFSDFDDVPESVAKTIHESSDSQTPWEQLTEGKKKKKVSQVKAWLNTEAVSRMTPKMLNQRDSAGDIRGWLEKIGTLLDQ